MAENSEINTLSNDTINLLKTQIDEWPLLGDNYGTFDAARCDEIHFGEKSWTGRRILLDYRKTSLTANLKAIAAGERPCFLCAHARPQQQRALTWKDYEILCNPYPASRIHFTIVNRTHTPQALGVRIADMAALSRIIPDSCIFYNGPKCGASAPDHMHFQAIAIEEAANLMVKPASMTELLKVGRSRLYATRPDQSAFGYFIMDIENSADIIPLFNTVLATMPCTGDEEPMMNVATFRINGAIRIAIMPRKRHRPLCYGAGEGQMLVSPASIEMMGKFITSRQEDFDRLDEPTMQRIYDDVAYTHDEFINFIKRLPE